MNMIQDIHTVIQFIAQHRFGIAVAGYWIFSAAVSALPDPSPGGSPGYLWLYRFCHTMAGNITTVFGNRLPGLKALMALVVVPLVLSSAACAARYTLHPGALNRTDSAAYDTLLIAEAVIDQARVENQTRPLSPGDKDALNTLVRSYNVAREAWLTYRGAITTNTPPDPYLQQLTKNLTDLTNAIEALRRNERLRVQAR